MNCASKQTFVADIAPKAISHIIGEKGQTIKGIQNKFGQGTRVIYDRTHKRFVINARTVELCVKVSEELYRQQDVWKKQRKEYFEKKSEEAHQSATRRQQHQEKRQQQHLDYVQKNPIKLNYKGTIKDMKYQKKDKPQTEKTQKTEKEVFNMNVEAFPTLGNKTTKPPPSSWNKKPITSQVNEDEIEDEMEEPFTLGNKDSSSWYSDEEEEDNEENNKVSNKDSRTPKTKIIGLRTRTKIQ